MATIVEGRRVGAGWPADPPNVRRYSLTFSGLFILVFSASVWVDWPPGAWPAIVSFTLIAGAADTLRIKLGREMTFAVSMPVVLAAAMVLSPSQAAFVGFLATADVREWTRQVPPSRALFNRCQVAACALLASAAFHALGGYPVVWPGVLLPAAVALTVDATLNAAFVAWPVAWMHGSTPEAVIRRMFEPGRAASVLRYACTGLLAPLLATTWQAAGIYGLATCLVPIALAWFSFREAEGLAAAAEAVENKNKALADALDGLAAERRDERLAIAGELHDDVLPSLFQVHLMGQVLSKDLEHGRLLDLEEDARQLRSAADHAQSSIREVVTNLRSSVLGPDGLPGILRLQARSLEAASRVRFVVEVGNVDAPRAVQLAAYQVARESMVNAAKHSGAAEVGVKVWQEEDGLLRLVVEDDGCGFDSSGSGPAGHFGLLMMSERVQALGGRLDVDSVLGRGTRVLMSLPKEH